MQHHPPRNLDADRTHFAASKPLLVAGLVAAGIAVLLVMRAWSEPSSQVDRSQTFFSAAYLVGYLFYLSISLGALFFTLFQHVVSAGWCVAVRRLGEILAANVVFWGVLILPILFPVLMGTSPLYEWSNVRVMAESEILQRKAIYLNGTFFAVRAVFYILVWGSLASYYFKHSRLQDVSGDVKHTRKLEIFSPAALILFALTVTFATFDWLMSLDPLWSSSIFAIYYFCGCVVASFAALILFALLVQAGGMLRHAITVEHYHDLGKLLFAFVVFWGYIAFSQYMLIWYANIPEESVWYLARQNGPWKWISVALLFGHLFLPFLGLLSREIKRRKYLLGAWALWILAAHWIDLYWLVMPVFSPDSVPFGWADAGCTLGLGCLYTAGILWITGTHALIPLKDPRLNESLAFENI